MKLSLVLVTALSCLGKADLLGIPTVPFKAISDATFDLTEVHSIVVDSTYATARDTDGLTTIPPTLWEFAETFRDDLAGIGIKTTVTTGRKATDGAIFCTLDSDKSAFRDAAGRTTSEGYRLSVSSSGITIGGASPLGVWWATRTVLQQAVLNHKKITQGAGIDAPGWGERGMMLDVARHYYPADFLVEMCSYLSFWKQNVFHLHLSDHVWSPYLLNTHERAAQLYAAFRVDPQDPSIAGLPRPANETYNPSVMESLQRKCALRGVTIVPELESPGHSIATTDWKPEIALGDFSMLNLSNPETLPTVKSYWKAVLPLFHSKVVHIGADEYDSKFIDEYTGFVNAMNDYIKEISGKAVRIWGTFAPSLSAKKVSKNVSVQHWQIGQDNALFDFVNNGYNVVNSDDYFYLDVKYSDGGVYPIELDISRVFNGAPGGGPFAPNIFDHANATNNPPRDNPNVLGHLAVLWNDWGQNASTYQEAYFMVRDGLPGLADKQWGGQLQQGDYAKLFAALQPAVPGQNLDLDVPSKGDTVLSYKFGSRACSDSMVRDQSGNRYHGALQHGATVSNGAVHFAGGAASIKTPLTSKGRDYTLSFSVQPEAPGGALFSGPDSALLHGNGTSPLLMLVSGNVAYPVNITLPTNTWSDVTVEGSGRQTFISVQSEGGAVQRQEVTILMGIWGGYMQLAPMAIPAPIATIGEGFKGSMKKIQLLASVATA